MIYVTGCQHFNHANIIKYTGRPFSDVAEMNEALTERWNEVVTDADLVIHLGDFDLGPAAQAKKVLAALRGRKFLVRGNHDRRSASWYRGHGFDQVMNARLYVAVPMKTRTAVALLTHRPANKDEYLDDLTVNVHAHIHEKESGLPRRVNVSVERTDYRPVKLGGLVRRVLESGGKGAGHGEK